MGMAAILVMWPLIFVINFLPSTLRSLIIKFECNRLKIFEKTMIQYIDGTPISDIGWKVNLDLWNLFIAIVLLG